MNQIKYEIVGRFENANKYGVTSKKTVSGYQIDEHAAKNAGCIIRKETDATYQNGGHIKIYGTPDMLKDVYALIDRYAKHDTEQAAAEKAEQAEKEDKAMKEEQKDINVNTLTEENIAAYLPALLMSLANDKHNSSAIMEAGIEAKVITPIQLLEYLQTGKMPAIHTFDVWKKAGFKVKKGEKAAFQARIWKHTEKVETDTEEQAEEKKGHDFIRKTAYFFTAEQVEKAPEEKPLPDLPEDVKQETRSGCVWISGNTKPIKEDLKAAGFSWSKKNCAWYKRAAA